MGGPSGAFAAASLREQRKVTPPVHWVLLAFRPRGEGGPSSPETGVPIRLTLSSGFERFEVKIMTWRLPALLLAALLLGACAPTTFVRTMEPNWNTVEIRKGLSGDDAWDAVVDLAARRFDIEVQTKEDCYLRTGWSNSWTITTRSEPS